MMTMARLDFIVEVNTVQRSHMDPEDVYESVLCGALECLDAGVTSVVDHFHAFNSPQHLDAAYRAIADAGIRCVLAAGTNKVVTSWTPRVAFASDHSWQLEHALRWAGSTEFKALEASGLAQLPTTRSSLVEVGLALDRWQGDSADLSETCALIQRSDAGGIRTITMHHSAGVWGLTTEPLLRFERNKCLSHKLLVSHGNFLSVDELHALSRHHCAGPSMTPTAETMLLMGSVVASHHHEALKELKLAATLGIDSAALQSGDLFHAMRGFLQDHRRQEGHAHRRSGTWPGTSAFPSKIALSAATSNAAQSVPFFAKCGCLRVKAKADIVVYRPATVVATASTRLSERQAVNDFVWHGSPRRIEMVLVEGSLRKKQGGNILLRDGSQVKDVAAELPAKIDAVLSRVGRRCEHIDRAQLRSELAATMGLANKLC